MIITAKLIRAEDTEVFAIPEEVLSTGTVVNVLVDGRPVEFNVIKEGTEISLTGESTIGKQVTAVIDQGGVMR